MTAALVAPIKGIFFDLGWTLLSPTTGNWMIPLKFYEILPKAKFDEIPEKTRRKAFFNAMQMLLENHLTHTEQEEYDLYVKYYKMIDSELELGFTTDEILEIARDHVCNDDNYVIFEDSVSTLRTLKERGYKLGIISDTWPSIERVLKNAGLYDFFDAITFSCHLGVCKPDDKLYTDAITRMGLASGETVFVDDLIMNLDGAMQHGIQPVLIAIKPDAEITAKYPVIHKTSEILDILP